MTGEGSTPPPDPSTIRITPWQDWDTVARQERTRELQRVVDAVFCEEVMGGLALLLIPILVIPEFFRIPHEAASFLIILDIAIWIFFVLEYACRLFVAEDRRAFVSAPWNILDLLIIGVPALALVSGTGLGIARYFRILRAMQAFQVILRGGRTVGRHLAETQRGKEDLGAGTSMRIRLLPLSVPSHPVPDSGPAWKTLPPADLSNPPEIQGRWLDFSGLTPADIPSLARITGIPGYTLEVKLKAHSYTRAEIHGGLATIFLRIPRLEQQPGSKSSWLFSWDGVLLAYDRNSVMTFSKNAAPILDRIPSIAASENIPLSGPAILYLIVREELAILENLALSAEEQIVHLEALPANQLPPNFLAMMYTDQKVQSRISSGILHTKTALEHACDHIQASFGKDTVEEGRLRSLIDRCSSVGENFRHISDSFSWMVDYYLNTASFSMNSVMKILAVLTALTMVPTIVGGLLGMNLIGNPWPATLFQMVTVVFLVMLLMAWVYYNIGWLKQD